MPDPGCVPNRSERLRQLSSLLRNQIPPAGPLYTAIRVDLVREMAQECERLAWLLERTPAPETLEVGIPMGLTDEEELQRHPA